MNSCPLMEDYLPIESRHPRGGGRKSGFGSSSSSSSGGTTIVVVGPGYIGVLPTWAVVLIIWSSLILTLFLCALLHYYLKGERR